MRPNLEVRVHDVLEDDLPEGRFDLVHHRLLLAWLREHVHRHGRRYSAAELCRRATGSDLSADPFFRYLEGKLVGVVPSGLKC